MEIVRNARREQRSVGAGVSFHRAALLHGLGFAWP